MYSLNNAEPVATLPQFVAYQGRQLSDPTQWFPAVGAALGWRDVGVPPLHDETTHHAPAWNTATGVWDVVAKTVQERRDEVHAEVTALFRFYRDKGVLVGGALIQTDQFAQGDLTRLLNRLQERQAGGEPDPTIDIATAAGNHIVATVAVAQTLVDGVTAYIEAVWRRDGVLNKALIDATTVAEINVIAAGIHTGWPSS